MQKTSTLPSPMIIIDENNKIKNLQQSALKRIVLKEIFYVYTNILTYLII